jgi:hypothetical protein
MWRKLCVVAIVVAGCLPVLSQVMATGPKRCEPIASNDLPSIRGGEEEPCFDMYWSLCEPHPANCDQAQPNCVQVSGKWQCSLAGEWQYKPDSAETEWWYCFFATSEGYEWCDPWQQACYWETKCPTECPDVPGFGHHCTLVGPISRPAALHEGSIFDWSSEECWVH